MATARKKNGNGVREIRPGVFVATMYDPRARGGTKHVGTFRVGDLYPTKTAARKAAERAKHEAEALRDLQLKAPTDDETCGSFARRWPRDYTERRSDTTLDHNRERVKAFIRDFEDRPLGGIGPDEARAWIQGGIVPPHLRAVARKWHGAKTLEGGEVEVPSHKSNLLVIRAMFNDAVNTGNLGVTSNPFATFRAETSQGRAGDAITILTVDELDLLIETAGNVYGDYGQHFGAIIETAAWSGLRPGELWALEIERHVDFEEGEIWVEHQIDKKGRRVKPKYNSVRTVHMLPPARSAIKRAIGGREHGPVFTNTRGQRLSTRTAHYYWHRIRAAFWTALPPERRAPAGKPEPGKIAADFDLYELRHFFGTQLGEMNFMPYEIADQMGHKDGGQLAMQRYIHARRKSKTAKDRALERFEEWQRREAAG